MGKHLVELEVRVSQTMFLKRGLFLEYLTLGWNVVGVIIVVLAGVCRLFYDPGRFWPRLTLRSLVVGS